MKPKSELESLLDESEGLSLIVARIGTLVEKEGYNPREAFEMVNRIKKGTFQALSEMYGGRNEE